MIELLESRAIVSEVSINQKGLYVPLSLKTYGLLTSRGVRVFTNIKVEEERNGCPERLHTKREVVGVLY